ncbi:MAG: DUF4838 domain-containing protein, partial [Candidatus Sumerlaeota bacterium]|nr:DUF4838 domain-containing protein [Candidatus Sumerlaeota bacterium]
MGGRSSFAGGIARLAVVALVSTAAAPAAGDGVTLVEAGRANAVICFSSGSKEAADILGRHIRQMSGVNLLIQEVASKAEVQDAVAAVILGEAAREFGLRVDGSSPSHEAFHLKTEGNRILLDGDSPSAVEWGVYEILERLGCGWYFDLPAGEVAPKRETITLPPVDTTQSPAFETRKLWGSGWTGPSDFKRWNRTGGIEAQTSHAWSRLVPPKEYGQSHPEYYPLRNGERSPGRQLCTTNPDVIRIAQDYVLKRLEEGAPSVSISPDDGGGFCECDRCRALDTPGYLEPSSGRICLTDRLMEFFNQVAGPAHERFPDRRVNFYAYADYSLPPKRVRAASSNLMAWMTPIRYCRIHGMAGEEDCPRRQSLKATIQDWAQVVRQFGLREYNYDLAECLVPFSKIHVWRSDLPWLHEAGCRAVNLESIHSIAVMGPSIWLSARLAWDVNADVDALMKRYWNDLFGERAGPVMKRYWDRIDAAWAHCPSHAGSFFCVPAVYTDELLKACRNDLNRAKDLIDDDAGRERWAIFDSGFQNAELYMNMLRLFNAGKYPEAAEALGRLRTHLAEALAKGWLNKYSQSYLERFAAAAIDQAAARAG